MMGDVIDIKGEDKDTEPFKHCSYYDQSGDIGIAMLDDSLRIIRVNDNTIEFQLYGQSQLFKRNELAEFLHLAALFIDSEDRWAIDGKVVCIDY